jgi:hypothetical protein
MSMQKRIEYMQEYCDILSEEIVTSEYILHELFKTQEEDKLNEEIDDLQSAELNLEVIALKKKIRLLREELHGKESFIAELKNKIEIDTQELEKEWELYLSDKDSLLIKASKLMSTLDPITVNTLKFWISSMQLQENAKNRTEALNHYKAIKRLCQSNHS